MFIIIQECLNNSNEGREKRRQKNVFFFLFCCCSHEGINGCFSLKTYFFFFFEGEASEVNRHSFQKQPRKQKKRATPLTQEKGLSIKLFSNTIHPPRFEKKKREIEHQFFPIFQSSRFDKTFIQKRKKKSLALTKRKCPGESER